MLKTLIKIQKILLIIFLVILPWQTRYIFINGSLIHQYWEYGTISLYITDVLIIILFINQIIINSKKVKLTIKQYLWPALFIVSLIVNLLFSLNKTISLFHLGWLILGLFLFFVLQQNTINKTTALLSFIIGSAISALLGIWQFISQSSFSSTYLGLAKHDPGELGTSVIETVASDGFVERWLRAYGSLDHPNMLGGLCALAMLFCFYLIISQQLKHYQKLIIFSCLILLTSGLITSFSRASWLAATLGLIIYLIIELKKNFKLTLKKIWPLLIIIALIKILFLIPYSYLIWPRFTHDTRLEKISTEERIAGYQNVWPIFKTKPIFGTGLGNYGLILEKLEPKKLVWFYQPVHNTFLLILTELGIIGFILLLILIIRALINAHKKNNDKNFIWAIIISLVILALFDHWLFSLHFGLIFCAIILGLSLKNNTLTELN